MGQPRDYRKIQAWEKAHAVVPDVYRATSRFPRDELLGLTSQIRRCAVSVPPRRRSWAHVDRLRLHAPVPMVSRYGYELMASS